MKVSKCPEKDKLQEMYATMTDIEIAQTLSVHETTVGHWRKKYNIPFIKKVKENDFFPNETYFDTIDTQEKAYILGFIYADGSVSKNFKCLSIAILESDRSLLDSMQLVMGSSYKITSKKSSGGYSNSSLSVLSISRKYVCKSLYNLGVIPNKSNSLNVHYPQLSPELDSHFIRGYLDGDGWVSKRQFGFVGSRSFLLGISEKIQERLNISTLLVPKELSSKCFKITYYRKDKNVINWIYKNAALKLNRKFDNYQNYWL